MLCLFIYFNFKPTNVSTKMILTILLFSLLEIVAPLGFPVIIPKNVDRSALQTEFGRSLDHSLEFLQHR